MFPRVTIAIFIVALAFSFAHAELKSINQFGGLNTDDDPLLLQEKQTPDSQNVLTDEVGGLTGRKGFIAFSTQTSKGLWEFPTSDGTRYMITHNTSDELMATSGATNFTTLISTVSAANLTAASVLGDRFYFCNVDDGMKYWDTSSTVVVGSTLTFSMLVTHKNRLVGAGDPSNPRLLYISKNLDGTTWDLAVDPTDDDPSQITVSGALDERITALFSSYNDVLVWFKPHSFGGLFGSNRRNFSIRTFDDAIGCSFSSSIQNCDGELRWLGPSRTIYGLRGSQFQLLSKDIDTLLSTIQQGDLNSRLNIQTDQADWEAGTSTNTSASVSVGDVVLSTFSAIDTDSTDWEAGTLPAEISTSTTPGRITYIDTFELVDDFADGDYTNNPTWVAYSTQNATVNIVSQALEIGETSTSGMERPSGGLYMSAVNRSTGVWKFQYTNTNNTARNENIVLYFIINSDLPRYSFVQECCWEGYRFRIDENGGTAGIALALGGTGTATGLGVSGSGYEDPFSDGDPHIIEFSRSELGVFQIAVDGITLRTSVPDLTYSSFTHVLIGAGWGAAHDVVGLQTIDDIEFYDFTQSATFESQVFDSNISTISFLGGDSTEAENGHSISYSIKDSTAAVGGFGSYVSWTPGSIPSLNNKQYLQYKVDFTMDDINVGNFPYVDDVTVDGRASTGTFLSQSIALGDITSWSNISGNETLNDGTIGYALYTDTDTTIDIADTATFSSSQTITFPTIPTISTDAYAFVSADFAITLATQAPALHNFIITWNEGSILAVPSVYFNQRYWLGLAVNATSNNRVLLYDRNREWQMFLGIDTDALVIYNSKMYFGNDSGIFQAEIGADDDGSDITSFYMTRDYALNGPNNRVFFDDLYMTTINSDSTLVTTYQVNGVDTDYSLSSFAMNQDSGVQDFQLPFPYSQIQQGKSLNFKWAVTGSNVWTILNANLYFTTEVIPTD